MPVIPVDKPRPSVSPRLRQDMFQLLGSCQFFARGSRGGRSARRWQHGAHFRAVSCCPVTWLAGLQVTCHRADSEASGASVVRNCGREVTGAPATRQVTGAPLPDKPSTRPRLQAASSKAFPLTLVGLEEVRGIFASFRAQDRTPRLQVVEARLLACIIGNWVVHRFPTSPGRSATPR